MQILSAYQRRVSEATGGDPVASVRRADWLNVYHTISAEYVVSAISLDWTTEVIRVL
jgi:hypothetical protein